MTKETAIPRGSNDSPDARAYIQREFGSLVGRTITEVRVLTDDDMEQCGWESGYGDVAFELVLDDGRSLCPSSDTEGNSPGFIFVN